MLNILEIGTGVPILKNAKAVISSRAYQKSRNGAVRNLESGHVGPSLLFEAWTPASAQFRICMLLQTIRGLWKGDVA